MITGIYRIYNTITKRSYIGSSKDCEERIKRHLRDLKKGKHHNFRLQRAWNQSGEDAFETSIIEECCNDKLFEREEFYLNKYGLKILYNFTAVASGGDILSTHPNKVDIRKRINQALIKRVLDMSPEERQATYAKYGEANGMFGKTHTDEVKQRISNFHKGNKYALGNKLSPEHRKQISERMKQYTGDKNPFYGKTHTEEVKRTISLKARGRKPLNRKKVIVNDTLYDSVTECSRQLKVCPATIIHRIKSSNPLYKSYTYQI